MVASFRHFRLLPPLSLFSFSLRVNSSDCLDSDNIIAGCKNPRAIYRSKHAAVQIGFRLLAEFSFEQKRWSFARFNCHFCTLSLNRQNSVASTSNFLTNRLRRHASSWNTICYIGTLERVRPSSDSWYNRSAENSIIPNVSQWLYISVITNVTVRGCVFARKIILRSIHIM